MVETSDVIPVRPNREEDLQSDGAAGEKTACGAPVPEKSLVKIAKPDQIDS